MILHNQIFHRESEVSCHRPCLINIPLYSLIANLNALQLSNPLRIMSRFIFSRTDELSLLTALEKTRYPICAVTKLKTLCSQTLNCDVKIMLIAEFQGLFSYFLTKNNFPGIKSCLYNKNLSILYACGLAVWYGRWKDR